MKYLHNYLNLRLVTIINQVVMDQDRIIDLTNQIEIVN